MTDCANQQIGRPPKRIQQSRQRGWRKPEGAACVGRPSKWGNPFRIGMFRDYGAAEAVADYKRWLDGDIGARAYAGPPPTRSAIRAALAGKDLLCWCAPGAPCHGDVLLKIANGRS